LPGGIHRPPYFSKKGDLPEKEGHDDRRRVAVVRGKPLLCSWMGMMADGTTRRRSFLFLGTAAGFQAAG
jgi:hypothetical protein